jgi:hypothetical protein
MMNERTNECDDERANERTSVMVNMMCVKVFLLSPWSNDDGRGDGSSEW